FACRSSPARTPRRCSGWLRQRISATASARSSAGRITCSSIPTSPSTSSASPRGSGFISTPRLGSLPTASVWRPARCATSRDQSGALLRRWSCSERAENLPGRLFQAKGLDAYVVLVRVAGVHPVRKRLDDRQKRGVRAHERRRVGRVVELDAGELGH